MPGPALARWLMLVLLLALAGPVRAIDLPVSPLTVETAQGPVQLQVELAATPESRARGLMFRDKLAPDHGMLFDFVTSQPVGFWMRNTLIPLDMIFIDERGRIVRIHEQAQPRDERTIPSVFPVRAVLEIAGGEAKRRGITVGDRVRHAIFGSG